MQIYSPAQYSHPESIAVSYFLRQNPWSALADPVSFVKQTHCVVAPHAHSQEQAAAYEADPTLFQQLCSPPARAFLSIPTGVYVILPGQGGLLLRIKSQPYAKRVENYYVAHFRTCHATYMEGCSSCASSVARVISAEDVITALNEGLSVEPWNSIVRDVEILGTLDSNGKDWRTLATPASIGAVASFWAPSHKI